LNGLIGANLKRKQISCAQRCILTYKGGKRVGVYGESDATGSVGATSSTSNGYTVTTRLRNGNVVAGGAVIP